MIPGAGSGIGRATCIAFAKENAKVVAVDKNLKNANHVLEILNGKAEIGEIKLRWLSKITCYFIFR